MQSPLFRGNDEWIPRQIVRLQLYDKIVVCVVGFKEWVDYWGTLLRPMKQFMGTERPSFQRENRLVASFWIISGYSISSLITSFSEPVSLTIGHFEEI